MAEAISTTRNVSTNFIRHLAFDRTMRRICAAGAIFLGLFIRIWLIATPSGSLDADEAIVGLMARRFLEGDFFAFYWGQPYGGTLETGVVAAAFALFGSTVWVLKLVPAALHAATAIVLWRIGKRLGGERLGVLAGTLFWLWPTTYVWMSIEERGFYEVAILLAASGVLLGLRLHERFSFKDLALFGLCAGAAWWSTPITILVFAPMALWLTSSNLRFVKHAYLPVATAIVGALPWLVHNLQNDWASRAVTQPVLIASEYGTKIAGFYEKGFPMVLGLRAPWSTAWVIPPVLGRIVAALVLAGAVWVLIDSMRKGRSAWVPIAAMALLYPFVFALSGNAWFLEEGRYLFMLAIPLTLLVARWAVLARGEALLLLIVAALTVAGLLELDRWERSPERPVVPPRDMGTMLDYLEQQNVTGVFADYWIVYRVSFETQEAIPGASLGYDRYPEHSAEVRASARPAYVFYAGSGEDTSFAGRLSGIGVEAERRQFENLAVYVPAEKVLPEELPPP